MKLLKKLKEELLFASVFQSDNEKVRKEILEDNRKAAIFWSTIQLLFWGFSLIISRFDEEYTANFYIYVTVIIVSAACLILALFICPKHLGLVPYVALALNLSLLGAGLGITINKENLRSAVIFCTLLIVPVSYVTDTLSNIILILLDFVFLMLLGPKRMDPEIFNWTRTFFIIFGLVGIFMGHYINKTRYERYVFADAAQKYAQLQKQYAYYDQMTGLKNRRAYAEKIDELTKTGSSDCCVIMADINGLKEINDTLGHDAGDELINGSAECLKKSFTDTDLIYRIGGDEFCIIMKGKRPDVENCLNRLEEISKAYKSRFIDGISISTGYVLCNDHPDFDSALKAADQKMYEVKDHYYESTGKNRRK